MVKDQRQKRHHRVLAIVNNVRLVDWLRINVTVQVNDSLLEDQFWFGEKWLWKGGLWRFVLISFGFGSMSLLLLLFIQEFHFDLFLFFVFAFGLHFEWANLYLNLICKLWNEIEILNFYILMLALISAK